MNSVAAASRLIVALDVPTAARAVELTADLEGIVSFYKVGLELVVSAGLHELRRNLCGCPLFVDLKLPNDIPETVRRTVAVCAELDAHLLTLSGSATPATIAAAIAGRAGSSHPRLLLVPLLSSQGAEDVEDVETFLLAAARRGLDAGCDGLIASGPEIGFLRRAFPETLIVSPGIRLSGSSRDDHKRSATPEEARRMGADHIVVGRAIRDAPDRAARRGLAREIFRQIELGAR